MSGRTNKKESVIGTFLVVQSLSCIQLFVTPRDCSTSRDISLSCFSERITKTNNAKVT